VVIAVLLGLYLTAMGMVVGVVVERMRFDGQRGEVLARYEQALRARNAQRMDLEVRHF
jgi:hypothetical protein